MRGGQGNPEKKDLEPKLTLCYDLGMIGRPEKSTGAWLGMTYAQAVGLRERT